MCQNMAKIMGLFSKELQELDRNTVQYMIDEMQAHSAASDAKRETTMPSFKKTPPDRQKQSGGVCAYKSMRRFYTRGQ